MKILLVEDEALIAMAMEDMLIDAGHSIIGLAGTVERARQIVGECPDIQFALLDVNLRGENVFPIAKLLEERGVPFIFTSGYGDAGIDRQFANKTVLSKPVIEAKLLAMLAELEG